MPLDCKTEEKRLLPFRMLVFVKASAIPRLHPIHVPKLCICIRIQIIFDFHYTINHLFPIFLLLASGVYRPNNQ